MKVKAVNVPTANPMPYLRVFLGISLLGVLIYKANFVKIIDLILKVNITALLYAFFLAVIALILSALRWQVVLRAQGFDLPLRYLFVLYLEGLFFNNFLPSSIGGDAVRFVELGKKIRNYSVSFSSVLGERVLSSTALGFISFVSTLFMFDTLRRIFPLIFAFLLVCISLVFLLFYAPQTLTRRNEDFASRYRIKDINKELIRIKNGKTVIKVLSLSCLFHLVLVLMNWSLFVGMGVKLNPLYYFIFIPVTQAVAMLPVSFNGLGVREGSYVLLFGFAGIQESLSLTAALAFLFVVTIVSLGGGLSFAFKKQGT